MNATATTDQNGARPKASGKRFPIAKESLSSINKRTPMAFLTGSASESVDERYKRQLSAALADGWIMLSEGPSGAQLEFPKGMKAQTKIALIIGVVLLLAWGFGLIVIFLALIDYAMQKKETKFVSRM